jgi:hypothetical protein
LKYITLVLSEQEAEKLAMLLNTSETYDYGLEHVLSKLKGEEIPYVGVGD